MSGRASLGDDIQDLLDSKPEISISAKFLDRWRKFVIARLIERENMVKSIHFRRLCQIRYSWRRIRYFATTSDERRRHTDHVANSANLFQRRRLLKKGMSCFIALSPRKQTDIAQRWFNRQLLVVTFGAWVRAVADYKDLNHMCLRADQHSMNKALQTGFDTWKHFMTHCQQFHTQCHMANILNALIRYRISLSRWQGFMRSQLTYSIRHKQHKVLDRYSYQKKRQIKHQYFALLLRRTKRRHMHSRALLHGLVDRNGPCGIDMAGRVIHELRWGVRIRKRCVLHDGKATEHYQDTLQRAGLEALRWNVKSHHQQKQAIAYAHTAMSLQSRSLQSSVPPMGRIRAWKWWLRMVYSRMHNAQREGAFIEDARRYRMRRLVSRGLGALRRFCEQKNQLRQWASQIVIDSDRVRCFLYIRRAFEGWKRDSRQRRQWKRITTESIRTHLDLQSFRLVATAWSNLRRWRQRYKQSRNLWIRSEKCYRHKLLLWGLVAVCARAPLTAVCSCPISSAARRLRKASSPGKGTDVSLICPPIGVLQKARVGFVQYACRVRRWQMTMACHHHMNKVWAYAMCTLRRVVGRQEQQRASVYRGIWFWKYWRLAMTLCRWRKRVARAKEQRDMLLGSYAMYEKALGTNAVRQWITAVSDCDELVLTKQQGRPLSIFEPIGVSQGVTEVRRSEVVHKCARKWLHITRMHRDGGYGRYRPSGESYTESRPRSSRRNGATDEGSGIPSTYDSDMQHEYSAQRMEPLHHFTKEGRGEEKPQGSTYPYREQRSSDSPTKAKAGYSSPHEAVPLSRASPRIPHMDMFDLRLPSSKQPPPLTPPLPKQHQQQQVMASTVTCNPPRQNDIHQGNSSDMAYGLRHSTPANSSQKSLSQQQFHLYHGASRPDMLESNRHNSVADLPHMNQSSLWELESAVAELAHAVAPRSSDIAGTIGMQPLPFTNGSQVIGGGNPVVRQNMTLQERKAFALALQDYADMLEGLARVHT